MNVVNTVDATPKLPIHPIIYPFALHDLPYFKELPFTYHTRSPQHITVRNSFPFITVAVSIMGLSIGQGWLNELSMSSQPELLLLDSR